jgi:hypothetical protein
MKIDIGCWAPRPACKDHLWRRYNSLSPKHCRQLKCLHAGDASISSSFHLCDRWRAHLVSSKRWRAASSHLVLMKRYGLRAGARVQIAPESMTCTDKAREIWRAVTSLCNRLVVRSTCCVATATENCLVRLFICSWGVPTTAENDSTYASVGEHRPSYSTPLEGHPMSKIIGARSMIPRAGNFFAALALGHTTTRTIIQRF